MKHLVAANDYWHTVNLSRRAWMTHSVGTCCQVTAAIKTACELMRRKHGGRIHESYGERSRPTKVQSFAGISSRRVGAEAWNESPIHFLIDVWALRYLKMNMNLFWLNHYYRRWKTMSEKFWIFHKRSKVQARVHKIWRREVNYDSHISIWNSGSEPFRFSAL